MLVWQKITYPFKKIGGKEISKELVYERFVKQGMKACNIENTLGYIGKKIECTHDCPQCLSVYLEQSLFDKSKGIEEKNNTSEIVTYNSVLDDMGEQQLTLF